VAHVGLVQPKQMNWFSKYEISANFQPSFFHAGDPATVAGAAVLGPKRAARMYPIKSVADAGGRILISSDWPAPAVNPLEIIQYALTRQPLDGSKPPLQPDQRITLSQALAAYTINAAWASRSDDETGSIAVGKRADLIVLDRNLFETPVQEIHRAQVQLTLLDGESVYSDPQFKWRYLPQKPTEEVRTRPVSQTSGNPSMSVST
jgi:predicted amidohydrolase YtcJ